MYWILLYDRMEIDLTSPVITSLTLRIAQFQVGEMSSNPVGRVYVTSGDGEYIRVD